MILCVLPWLLFPSVLGQLVLGPCPIPPAHIEDPDLARYSGKWYILAQSSNHPLKAARCQNVEYQQNDSGLHGYFSFLDDLNTKTHVQAKVFPERPRKHPGELKLKFETFPRTFQFRILHTNYTDVAVEYTCLSGVFNYTAHMTILHRQVHNEHKDVDSLVKKLDISHHVKSSSRENMKLVNHQNC